ncbi:formyltransferase family protein [Onishia taeanensis]
MTKKVVLIASSGGAVFSRALQFDAFRDHIFMIVSDRQCGAIEVAKKYGIASKVLSSNTGAEFSDAMYDYFQDQRVDLFVSSYSKLFSGKFIKVNDGKLVNFHPAILPACPGLEGFADTVRSGSRFIGSTVHYVDEGIDTGKPLMQSARPYDPRLSIEENRHKVHLQQSIMLLQLVAWLADERIVGAEVEGASYLISEFSPNIEDPNALSIYEPS